MFLLDLFHSLIIVVWCALMFALVIDKLEMVLEESGVEIEPEQKEILQKFLFPEGSEDPIKLAILLGLV